MLSLAKFIKKKIELRENLVGTGFLDPPRAAEKAATIEYEKLLESISTRVNVIGEVQQANCFSNENVYLSF